MNRRLRFYLALFVFSLAFAHLISASTDRYQKPVVYKTIALNFVVDLVIVQFHCYQMLTQVTLLNSKVRDTRVTTSIKTMQVKHLIDEKSELQSLLRDRIRLEKQVREML